eukprot:g12703.t1
MKPTRPWRRVFGGIRFGFTGAVATQAAAQRRNEEIVAQALAEHLKQVAEASEAEAIDKALAEHAAQMAENDQVIAEALAEHAEEDQHEEEVKPMRTSYSMDDSWHQDKWLLAFHTGFRWRSRSNGEV